MAPAAPPWIPVPRGDWLRLVYGLPAAQAGVWSLLLGEALADGQATLPEPRCAEVAGTHWPSLRDRLTRARRIELHDNQVHIPWIAERLADAQRRIVKARNRAAARHSTEESDG